ncbi:similar to Saccharomyces cerevisiae YFR021W ATG18 Phosphoinositide binding protein required for vesicle formation in autophagy and the cytoplasm-to-vacuole targeting (Cvt) pathway [Maudiozyma saulgeensis]|uniref:Similar to Saccharomyces cerevisiae YFR021W ATG18 Phosphoinositide binding protein required for vesicle formation in autophagy and the cytoplasm-to-vacuole targeting (Cvt) pathway n=1 Tax=Maudiozyma saulgeensis TaxID=1789683 RepID=A0A1X7QZU0_9SACH|nr:similar to Saccharomyces cerevisiae YFR021W ATG18 Phosphoinositide binding protein required for vesicle formation in autophagy and the cytoplasm-to-vacuole targeting (Cvt) pathway [Kazachstania saulgeensis]
MDTKESIDDVVNCIDFNQTGACISLGTSRGYDIFNCDPFGKFYSESEPDIGGYSIVEMLFSTSLVALVGNGDSPNLSPRKLRLVNIKKRSIICEITFPTSILSVKMNKSRVVVLLNLQIYIYDINNMTLLYVIDREPNQTNLISLSPNLDNNVLAYPSTSTAIYSEIRPNVTSNNINILHSKLSDPLSDDAVSNNVETAVDIDEYEDNENIGFEENTNNENNESYSRRAAELNLDNSNNNNNISNNVDNSDRPINNGDVILFDLDELQPTMVIEAHQNGIAALALSPDGLFLATASEKGTIIRIFNATTGFKLYQFRRGTYSTKIYSMSFSEDNQFLLACSSSKTVHIFKLGNIIGNNGLGVENDRVNGDIIKDDDDAADDNNNNLNNSCGGGYIDDSTVRKPYVDASRKTVARMIRNSSQNLTRRAAKTLGQIFPYKVTSILEPSRHFASLKIPIKDDVDKHVRSSAFIGGTTEISISDYPELFSIEDKRSNITNKNNSGGTVTGNIGIHGNRAFQNGYKMNSESNQLPTTTTTASSITMMVIRVVTTEGYLYNYVLDPERGGDCLLLSQYSLIEQ